MPVVDRRCFLGQLGLLACLPPASAPATLRAQRLSWAGLRLEAPGLSLFVDAWTNVAAFDGDWKQPIVPLEASSSRRFALVSHVHNDHFDPDALRALLGERGSVVCHEASAEAVLSRGLRARPARLWEPMLLDDAWVTAVPAVDGLGAPQVSWVIAAGGRRILHGGDTLWHGAFWQIQKLGPFDAAFLPINAARLDSPKPPSGQPISLGPEQAVAASVVAGARVLVPIHYGVTGSREYVEVDDATAKAVAEGRRRGLAVQVVAPGGWVELP
jgi:L-ascorbate metabolism protein UlaG (beta-lactamase superfamily)